ncbi:uncharacterized protein N7496_010751 [Penicillium cataractarum]|uniref:DUF7779 domain-containing protein n=1 Tax=Penicillium cataractarum TaxID=2100454 RepID=A0A9W9RDQ2_9EURO|nr:uncharacterized protein N7496_010751 [Penicillium cataractarum]KAJ5358338.1 hypothetical protein N7496_010751 [Penicillium cataractarum]
MDSLWGTQTRPRTGLDGFGHGRPDGDLKAALQKVLDDSFTDDERSQIKAEITIVPSCYESDTQRVALVQFRGGVPQFLGELRIDPLGAWQVEMGDDDINFDSHFFGFTQLYAPDENEPVVADIMAIAGLDRHTYGSWLSSHGIDTILDYGRELMEEIKKIRNIKEEDHPAITSLYRATYGMILFTIPHKGLVIDDIQQMLAGDKSHPRGQLLHQISSKSDLLVHQLADFKNLIRDRKVVSFYETEQTRRLDLESGRWKRTRDFITIAGADSALLQLPDHIEDKVPLHANHSIIVKFDTRNAAGYRTVLDKLRVFSRSNGTVSAQTRPKPQPCSTVPFKKDPMFVGREAIISAIKDRHKEIGQTHERVALVGLAGVGKTQIAIEYSYRVRESTPDTWAAHGSILVISRNGLAARNLVGDHAHVITVQPMNEEDSIVLLRARIPGAQSGESREDEKALVQALEFVPLAITQAGSYIANRPSRVTISRYLQLFRESESNQAHLLQHKDAKDLRRDPSIRHAVVTTWQLSFDQIRHDRPVATNLLALMSMFDREGILEGLIRGDSDEVQFEDAVAPLISYSLVRVKLETASFDMHRLVQLSVRTWLEIHLELARCVSNLGSVLFSVNNLGLVLNNLGKHQEAETMHRRVLEVREKTLGCEHTDTLSSVSNLGNVLYRQEKFEEAEAMYRRALRGSEKVLGREHPDMLTCVNNLGLVLDNRGKHQEAEAMHRRALETREKVLRREHPDTLTGVNNLGNVLSS